MKSRDTGTLNSDSQISRCSSGSNCISNHAQDLSPQYSGLDGLSHFDKQEWVQVYSNRARGV